MTVAELIAHLQTLPKQDALVYFECDDCSCAENFTENYNYLDEEYTLIGR